MSYDFGRQSFTGHAHHFGSRGVTSNKNVANTPIPIDVHQIEQRRELTVRQTDPE